MSMNNKKIITFFIIFFIFASYAWGADYINKEINCFYQSTKNNNFTRIFAIPIKNKQEIHKYFPKIPISKNIHNIKVKQLTKYIKTKTSAIRITREKRNATLIFNLIHDFWNRSMLSYEFLMVKNNKQNTLSAVRRYLGYLNDFVAHTNYTYNYRKTAFIYIFYIPNTQQSWISIPYMVKLNKQSLLHIRYEKDYCSNK